MSKIVIKSGGKTLKSWDVSSLKAAQFEQTASGVKRIKLKKAIQGAKQFTLKVPPELRAWLKSHAAAEGISLLMLFNRIVCDFLKSPPSILENQEVPTPSAKMTVKVEPAIAKRIGDLAQTLSVNHQSLLAAAVARYKET
jgi:predicted HicB family RNase H-like nuclease